MVWLSVALQGEFKQETQTLNTAGILTYTSTIKID